METKFQTSFIPKKPITPQNGVPRAAVGTSILMFFAVIVFVGSLVWAGASYVGVGYYKKLTSDYQKDLKANQDRFNTPLIQDLSRANQKIDMAKLLLSNHVAVSEAFNIIAALTVEKVKFSEFTFTAPNIYEKQMQQAPAGNSNNPLMYEINMKGIADGFNSIAFQSEIFGKSTKYGTNKVVKNPILSDLAVDLDGNVTFNFSAQIAMPDISYEKVLKETEQAEGTLPAPTQ